MQKVKKEEEPVYSLSEEEVEEAKSDESVVDVEEDPEDTSSDESEV